MFVKQMGSNAVNREGVLHPYKDRAGADPAAAEAGGGDGGGLRGRRRPHPAHGLRPHHRRRQRRLRPDGPQGARHSAPSRSRAAGTGLTAGGRPQVGSFDAGYGCTAMARLVGQKRAREMWFLARLYSAQQALAMGLVNAVVPLAELEAETLAWCREMLRNSPTALRLCKAALNAAEDGHAGLQEMGGAATLLFYQTGEGAEGRAAFAEKRPPDFSKFKRFP